MLLIPTGFPVFLLFLCLKAVLEHTVVPLPCEHQLNSFVRCCKNGEKKAINDGRETDHHNNLKM